jgi:hypothetical protein
VLKTLLVRFSVVRKFLFFYWSHPLHEPATFGPLHLEFTHRGRGMYMELHSHSLLATFFSHKSSKNSFKMLKQVSSIIIKLK